MHFALVILLFGELLFALAVATPVWRGAGGASPGHRPRRHRGSCLWRMGPRGERYLRSGVARRRDRDHEWHAHRAVAQRPLVSCWAGPSVASGGLALWPCSRACRAAAGGCRGRESREGVHCDGRRPGRCRLWARGVGRTRSRRAVIGAHVQIVCDVVHLLAAHGLGALPDAPLTRPAARRYCPGAALLDAWRGSVGALVASGVGTPGLVGDVPAR